VRPKKLVIVPTRLGIVFFRYRKKFSPCPYGVFSPVSVAQECDTMSTLSKALRHREKRIDVTACAKRAQDYNGSFKHEWKTQR